MGKVVSSDEKRNEYKRGVLIILKNKIAYYISEYEEYRRCKVYGLSTKIEMQAKQMKDAGFKVVMATPKKKIINEYLDTLNFFSSVYKWEAIDIPKECRVIYIRYLCFDFGFLHFLRRIKKQKKNIKIIIEIPTYPFIGERIGLIKIIKAKKEEFFAQFLKKYVNRIVLTAGDFNYLYGVKVINAINGTDFSRISPRECSNHEKTTDIHIISVANMAFWHGYDRVLQGMAQYYKSDNQRKVIYHIVGKGEIVSELRKYVKRMGIQDYVIFHGCKWGKELNRIYDQCEVGIEVLGKHRCKMAAVSSIKSSEYGAKGLPMISSVTIGIENRETMPYILKISSDETALEINQVILFYDKIYKYKMSTPIEIREVFEKYCDIKHTFAKVIQYMIN